MRGWKNLPLLLISLGGVLLLASAIWSHFSDPHGYWTEADAKSHAQSGSEYHALAHQWEHAHTQTERQGLEQGLDQARARFELSSTALQQARDRHERPARLMRWSGTVCLVLGAIGYYVLREARD